jgi:predicted regulator of Ras-like GTPase activity (Roadblock/LC7/MglB family)
VGASPLAQSALEQLAEVPGVVGSMVFETSGALVASAFPPVFERETLRQLASRLTADSYVHQWMVGEDAALGLRYADGHAVVRSLDGSSWLLVLCTAEANAQLLSMSLTQIVRRLRTPGPPLASVVRPATGPAPSPVERMRAVVEAELGEHAAQALDILGRAGPKPRELLRAAADVEKLTRLFIDRKKADDVGRRLREILGR